MKVFDINGLSKNMTNLDLIDAYLNYIEVHQYQNKKNYN